MTAVEIALSLGVLFGAVLGAAATVAGLYRTERKRSRHVDALIGKANKLLSEATTDRLAAGKELAVAVATHESANEALQDAITIFREAQGNE